MEIDLVAVNRLLLQCAKLVSASRRLLQDVGVVFPHMSQLERELRERAGEIQVVMREQSGDGDRPLLENR